MAVELARGDELDAECALAWAAQLPGWHQDGRPALFVYTPDGMLVSG